MMKKLNGLTPGALFSLLTLSAGLCAMPTVATAQVYRCALADGSISLGDRPCAVGVPGEPVKGLPGVPVPVVESATRPQPTVSAECERAGERTGRYEGGGSAHRSAASARYSSDRYQQDCWGSKTRTSDKSREAAVRREFADQACDIKHRAVQDGYQKRATFNDVDRRAFDRLAADVARGC